LYPRSVVAVDPALRDTIHANEPFRWLGIQASLRYYRLSDPKNP
jgi:hypothetical protein